MPDLNIMYVAIIMNFKLIPFIAGQPASPVERFTLWLSVKQGLLSCSHVFPVWKLSNWLRAERARAKPPLKLTHLGVCVCVSQSEGDQWYGTVISVVIHRHRDIYNIV